MHGSKLIKTLKTLSAKEMRQFGEFVHSPLHNKHIKLRSLVDMLQQSYPSFMQKNLAKEAVYAEIFPGQPYNEHKVTDLMSYLVKLLEDFLAFAYYNEDELLKKQSLLKAFREKGMDKQFVRTREAAEALQKKNIYRDEHFFYYQYLFEREADYFFIRHERRKQDESLQRKVDNLDLFYLSAKLKSICEMINRKNIVAGEFEFSMLDELLDYVKRNMDKFENVPAISIYYQVIVTLSTPEGEDHFQHLKQLLAEHSNKFTRQEASAMYGYAQNYCVKCVNNGNLRFLEELFGLYKLQIEQDIFEGQYVSQWHYKNIVSAALRVGEYDWTAGFIEKFRHKIVPEHRENAYTYNLASYYYGSNNYDKALQLLQSVEFTDVYYHLGAKSMLLKMYYDLDEEESLFSLMDAFKIYLRRNKLISDYQRKVHSNLVRYTKKAFRLKIRMLIQPRSVKENDIQALKQQIEMNKEITSLDWLLKRVEELAAEL